jgi:hypothetical protein
MKMRIALIALALLLPAGASAAPITAGNWTVLPSSNWDSNPFFDGRSWDCPACNVADLLAGYGPLEYLHDGTGRSAQFRFDDPVITPTVLFSITAWTHGVFGRRADGAFTYDSGTGRVSNSWDNPEQYALFRVVGQESIRYFIGVEDILLSEPLNDRDYNDYVAAFSEPVGIPEPSTLLLFGMSMVGIAAQKKARALAPSIRRLTASSASR